MKVKVHDQVSSPVYREGGADWQLFFQRVTFKMDDGRGDLPGFRFMWRKDGKLQTTRGQARIHDAKQLIDLLEKASAQGWFQDSRLHFD